MEVITKPNGNSRAVWFQSEDRIASCFAKRAGGEAMKRVMKEAEGCYRVGLLP